MVIKSKLKASIIIVNYNGLHFLKQCLNSLLKSNEGDTEIIVVDNASQDGSIEMINKYFPQVSLICLPENVGFGAGNNVGAREAHGEYLAFLNPDTVVEPGWLKGLIVPLEKNPLVGMTTSKILLMDKPDLINTCGNDVHISGLTLCRGLGAPASAYNQPADVNAISGAAFAIRRELFDKLGGFDPGFFLYMEDTDLSLRARLAGFKIVFTPDSVIYHDYALRFGTNKIYYQERNRYRMLFKCFNWRTLFALIPVLLIAEFATWGFILIQEPRNWRNKLRSYTWVFKHFNQIWISREQAQSLRTISDREVLPSLRTTLDFDQVGKGVAVRAARKLINPLFNVIGNLIKKIV
jgi:GT2 family glycosyltransferase